MINDEKIQRSALRLRLDPNDRAQRESLMAALLETLQVIRRPFPAKSSEDWNPEEFCKKTFAAFGCAQTQNIYQPSKD
jgi:hypothetical protein